MSLLNTNIGTNMALDSDFPRVPEIVTGYTGSSLAALHKTGTILRIEGMDPELRIHTHIQSNQNTKGPRVQGNSMKKLIHIRIKPMHFGGQTHILPS